MTKVHYHTLGAAVYFIGVAILIFGPSEGQSSPFFGQSPVLLMLGWVLQAAGILVYLKWLKEERETLFTVYQKYYPLILAFFLIGVPILGENLLETTSKTFAYSNPNGKGTVEYIEDESTCTTSAEQSGMVQCTLTLKNYEHQSKTINVHLSLDQWTTSEEMTVRLLQRQEKQVKVEFPINNSETVDHLKAETTLTPEISLNKS
ncbi:hypothetical protein M3181_04570 [Mesobacillus maritimus]|uniref:hypothetical protein n=1 Tax=Mesobacillus maritimus TaxID=1643336 RepID=UPI00204059DD|nr:hypothetical protein [Mesobacillus maritimus]MCM3668277.1 hypothetical protein [Mesobacillus maritimus]